MTRKKARKAKIWFCRAVFMYSLTGHTRRFNLRFPGNLRLAGGSPERRKERMLAEERPERSYMPGTWLSSSSVSFTPSSTMQFGAGKFSRFSHPDWKRELTWQVEEGETPREQSTWAHFAKTSVFFLFLVCTTWPAWGRDRLTHLETPARISREGFQFYPFKINLKLEHKQEFRD